MPHLMVPGSGEERALTVVAPRLLYEGPADELSSLRPIGPDASEPDLARPPGELIRIESSGRPPPNEMFLGSTFVVMAAYDTGNAVRAVLELTFASARAAEAQASYVESAIAAARSDASDPFAAILGTATLTRAGLRSTLVMTFSYDVASALFDAFASQSL